MEPMRNLLIPDDVRQLLEKRMILEQDVRRVINHAEAGGDCIQDQSTGHCLASLRVSCVTYWVEYSVGDSAYTVYDAWSHRMEVR